MSSKNDKNTEKKQKPSSKPIRLTDRKHKAILKAGLEEFKKNGFLLTSMDSIAARAQVSKRTVYNHFPSKQELFKNIVSNLYGEVRKTSTVPFDPNEPLKKQLKTICDQQIALLTSQKFVELARITFSEYIRSPELARDVFADMKDDNPTFYQWICEAMEHGSLRETDPVIPAKQFISMIKSFFLWPQLFGAQKPGKEKSTEIVDSTIDMFLDYYASEK